MQNKIDHYIYQIYNIWINSTQEVLWSVLQKWKKLDLGLHNLHSRDRLKIRDF